MEAESNNWSNLEILPSPTSDIADAPSLLLIANGWSQAAGCIFTRAYGYWKVGTAGILSFWLCTYLPPVHHPRRHLSWLWLWLWILPAPASPLYISSAKHSLAISKLYHLQVLCILVEHICVQQWHNRTLVVPFSLLMPFHLFFAHSARRVQSLFPAIMRPPLAVPDDG